MERAPDYQPYYCEENVWRLCQDPRLAAAERLVAVITGAGLLGAERRCLFFHQRCAGAPQEPVLWDFHVVLLACAGGWQVWDLDSDLGAPVAAADYLSATFGDQRLIPAALRPRLRLIDAATYVARLRSTVRTCAVPTGAFSTPRRPGRRPAGGGRATSPPSSIPSAPSSARWWRWTGCARAWPRTAGPEPPAHGLTRRSRAVRCAPGAAGRRA